MKTIDDLVVLFATCIMRSVLAVGTGLAYLQMFLLVVVFAMIGTVGLAVVITIARGLMLAP